RNLTRRRVLRSAAGLAAIDAFDLANFGCASPMQAAARARRGGHGRLNVAVIGLGGRSSSHLTHFNTKSNCLITHICDPDTARANAALDKARTSNDGAEALFEQDLRRVLDDKDVDIVSIATCNHWHSLAAI